MDKEEAFFNEPSIMHHLDFLLRDMFSTVPISDGIFGTIQWLPRIFSVSPRRWDTYLPLWPLLETQRECWVKPWKQ